MSKYRRDYLTYLEQAAQHLPCRDKELAASLYAAAVAGDVAAENALWDLFEDEGIDSRITREHLEYGKRSYNMWTPVQRRQFKYYTRKYGFVLNR
jgi:hypothetical protein